MSAKEDYLRAELKGRIEWFETQSEKHKLLYRNLRYIAYGLTGGSTVLASIALTHTSYQEWLNLLVVIATAGAGVAASVEGLRKPAELWIHERSILYALRDLKREMDYKAAGLKPLAIDEYFNRFQSILTQSKEKWAGKVERSGKGASS